MQLTSSKGSNNSPRWLANAQLAFVSTRDGESQVWTIPVTGGEARKLTNLSTEASGLQASTDGAWVAFASDIFPDCSDDDCNRQRAAEEAQLKSKAKVFDRLPYRVWNAWKDGRRSHLFVQSVSGGPARDLTPGDFDVPHRWSAQLFASRGYVVALINPRGSTGYGQRFTDEISGDWGGAVYEDLMKGLDHLIATYHFIDGSRVAAAGASYGGYMVNWMLGSTDRFRCFVSHDGVFNPWSMYGTTEELWFPEWEFRGTPYDRPDLYDRSSPLRKAKNFRTPTLVVHGQLDYRVDVSEGFQLFTALQRQGVPSKMLYFPDEGHWVMRPANAAVWYTTVLDWIDTYTK